MNAKELKAKYTQLYELMATSNDVKNMQVFGRVMTSIIDWLIEVKPEAAEEFICQLESVRWENYLTPKEAAKIIEGMKPKAPWSHDQWKSTMEQHGYELEEAPSYNRCAMWVTMNMIMSDSGRTISDYIPNDKLFDFVHKLAVDKLKDEDKKFNIRSYFGL